MFFCVGIDIRTFVTPRAPNSSKYFFTMYLEDKENEMLMVRRSFESWNAIMQIKYSINTNISRIEE